jgi:hypothetical protein
MENTDKRQMTRKFRTAHSALQGRNCGTKHALALLLNAWPIDGMKAHYVSGLKR